MLKTIGLTCALLLAASTFAAAQTVPNSGVRPPVSAQDFTKRLENEGFTNVRKVEPTVHGFSAVATKDGKDVQVDLTENNDIHVIR